MIFPSTWQNICKIWMQTLWYSDLFISQCLLLLSSSWYYRVRFILSSLGPTSCIFKHIPGCWHVLTGPPTSTSTGLTNLVSTHHAPVLCIKLEKFKLLLRSFLCFLFLFFLSLNDSTDPHSPSDLLPMSPSVYAVLREHLSPTVIETAVCCKLFHSC